MIKLTDETKVQSCGMIVGLLAYSYAVKNNKMGLPFYVVGSFVGAQVRKAMIVKAQNKKLGGTQKNIII